ncbi:GNAT family N-acetyltransferase [Actinophytocola sediminis]
MRNIRRRCAHIEHELVDRGEYQVSPAVRELARTYFATQEVNVDYRLRRFFEMVDAPFCTHVLRFWDSGHGRPVGLVPLLVRDGIVHYGIPIYDPAYRTTSIGNHMMGTALSTFAESGHDHCYLGSCYTPGDLYKTRFNGMQFFNGYTWSDNRDELHFFVSRRDTTVDNHTLGSTEYLDEFCAADVQLLGKQTELTITAGAAVSRP